MTYKMKGWSPFTQKEETFKEKARRVRMIRPPIGEHFEGESEGTTSTHLMSDDDNLTAWPGITNKKPPYAGYVKQSQEEAKAAGEIFKFNTKKEMTDFARKGNWKLQLASDLHKDIKNK